MQRSIGRISRLLSRAVPRRSASTTATMTSASTPTATTATPTAVMEERGRGGSAARTRRLVVQPLEGDILLKKFLGFHLQLPVNLVERLVRQHAIWVIRADGSKLKPLSAKSNLLPGDTVHVRHAFDEIARQRHPATILQQQQLYFAPLDPRERSQMERALLYKDADILVLNKPAGLAVQAGTKTRNHLQRFFSALRFDYDESPRLVHRLDKKTTGVLLLARHRRAAEQLSEMFRRAANPTAVEEDDVDTDDAAGDEEASGVFPWQVEKTYWAVLTGIPAQPSGTIDRHLYVPPESRVDISDEDSRLTAADGSASSEELPSQVKVSIQHPSRVSPYHHRYVKRAVTHYEVIAPVGRRGAWVRLQPETGRKHQLRVHCSEALRASILGDFKYGVRSYRKLHEMGWGTVFDFSKWTGVKSTQGEEGGGMPMFLHLRQLVIRNYFPQSSSEENCGDGDAGDTEDVATAADGNGNGNVRVKWKRRGTDLVLTASLPEEWRLLMKAVGLDASQKV